MEIEKELKDKLKQQRLDQYKMQLYSLEMDLVAFTAIGDEEAIRQTKERLEHGRKAYQAVLEME